MYRHIHIRIQIPRPALLALKRDLQYSLKKRPTYTEKETCQHSKETCRSKETCMHSQRELYKLKRDLHTLKERPTYTQKRPANSQKEN